MGILQEGAMVGDYKVLHLIKENEYTETYKVVNEDNNPYFVKLYVLKRTPSKLLDKENHEVMEISILRNIKQANVVSYITDGVIDTPVGDCHYVVTNYFTGENLADKLSREGKLEEELATQIFVGVLNGLGCLHDNKLCHNDVTPANIMLSESMDGTPELIDLGHASAWCSGSVPFVTSDLDVRYCANATAAGMFNEHTDLFSVFAVYYTMLTGKAPWELEISEDEDFAAKMSRMKKLRNTQPLDINGLQVSDRAKYMLEKGLCLVSADSYRSVGAVLADLRKSDDKIEEEKTASQNRTKKRQDTQKKKEEEEGTGFVMKRGTGRGFDDIAGMSSLKALLQQKVIFVIQNKELAEEYKLTPPNGMLLYGPPGCGKTFFAEKFAEQTAFNFILVKSSDLASIFVHGTQEKIGQLFKQAEENAPVVICFDEFDAFVPNRTVGTDTHLSSEVNEFLSQLNNCSKRGIFVIATTNRPDRIDPAVLRTGRIDKHIYVPMPDKEARRELFSVCLKGRPYDENAIDLDALAESTDGYIASDIAFIVNDAAMTAAFTHTTITQEMLEQSIRETTPSISKDAIAMYDALQTMMEGIERNNLTSTIGYKPR